MYTRIRYLATTPFSYKKEQATTKFAATYPCPTPYGAKVAMIVGGIRVGLDPVKLTKQLAKTEVVAHPWGEGVVNTHLVKHWEVPRKDTGGNTIPGYYSSTVAFREYLYFDGGVDLYVSTSMFEPLRPVFPGVNCFGKQGSFFSLLGVDEQQRLPTGIAFSGSDLRKNATWKAVSNFGGTTSKPRVATEFKVAMQVAGGGTNYLHLKFSE